MVPIDVSIEDIRRTSGIQSDVIEDDDVSRIIPEAITKVESFIGSSFEPETTIEAIDPRTEGDYKGIYLTKQPILNIRKIKINDTTVTPKYVKVYPGGKLVLTTDAEKTRWDDSNPQNNIVKYQYGLLGDGETQTTTSSDVTSGGSTTISVNSTDGFDANDWVKLSGIDGNIETVQISSVGTSDITADLRLNHASGSIVRIQKTPKKYKRLVEVIASLMLVARIVGQSYTDIVGYGLEGFDVQKGEPYTQWKETYRQLNAERENLIKHVRRMPAVG